MLKGLLNKEGLKHPTCLLGKCESAGWPVPLRCVVMFDARFAMLIRLLDQEGLKRPTYLLGKCEWAGWTELLLRYRTLIASALQSDYLLLSCRRRRGTTPHRGWRQHRTPTAAHVLRRRRL